MEKSIKNARNLRRNMTDVETKLWYQLKDRRFYGVKFRRQHPIKGYIVDFVSLEHKLVIELDGGQHAIEKEKDAKRTAILEREGYAVIRFWNNDIAENMNGVLHTIAQALGEEYEL